MTITYCRNDPVSGRWLGVNRLLTEFEVDFNFFQHEGRITTLENNFTLTVSIASITQPQNDQLLITMTDSTTRGPFLLPSAVFSDRGAWAPSTPYLVNDTFTMNGTLYRVLFAHTSALTFDAGATDGAGHQFYAAMMSSAGNALPTGGATGQTLQKSSGTDFAATWGYKLPTGGSTNQVLLKQSATNQDAVWTTLGATMVSFTPSTASTLTSTNVSDALEEVAATGGSTTLRGLTDVAFSTADPQSGAIIYFDGSHWVATPTPITGQVMAWDGSAWVSTTQLFSNIPQNSQISNYTTILTDGEKHIFHPSVDTTARTYTIPANSSVAYPVGTVITFVNQNGAGVITIAITTDTMRLAGAGTAGSRTLAANGIATALKITTTEWIISGTGLT